MGVDPGGLGRGLVSDRGGLDGDLLPRPEKMKEGADALLSTVPQRSPDAPGNVGAAEGVGPRQWLIRPAPKCVICQRMMFAVWVGGERFFECGFHGSRGRLKV